MSVYNVSADDVYRPSFFELIAADRLVPSLQPAVNHLILLISRRLPFFPFSLFSRYQPEVFYTLLFLLQRHYLRLYDSTFAENFYGLKRLHVTLPAAFRYSPQSSDIQHIFGQQSTVSPPGTQAASLTPVLSSLSPQQRTASLVLTVLLPYIRTRLDVLYTALHHNITADGFQALPSASPFPLLSRLERAFTASYPWLHAAVEGVSFVYQLRYLLELGLFFGWGLERTGLVVRRMGADDMQKAAQTAAAASSSSSAASLDAIWLSSAHQSLLSRLRSLLSSLSLSLSSSAKYALLLSLLAFRFIDWMQTHGPAADSPSTRLAAPAARPLASLPVPPPPPAPLPARDGIPLPADTAICPLCQRLRTNAAASCSGYVFCYPCIFAYVNEYRQCPVTKQPCKLEQIRKIYDT